MKTRIVHIEPNEVLEIRHIKTKTVIRVALDFDNESVQVSHYSRDLGYNYFGDRFFIKLEKVND